MHFTFKVSRELLSQFRGISPFKSESLFVSAFKPNFFTFVLWIEKVSTVECQYIIFNICVIEWLRRYFWETFLLNLQIITKLKKNAFLFQVSIGRGTFTFTKGLDGEMNHLHGTQFIDPPTIQVLPSSP